MVSDIYETRGMPGSGIDKDITKEFARRLWSGTETGFGKKLDDIGSVIDYDDPDALMLQKLNENVWHFSAAKNHHQLKELSRALVDENGKLRTWEQFKPIANGINNRQVNQWLKVEYELAIAGGNMAAEWQRCWKERKQFPFVQFDVVMDEGTTDICTTLHDVIVAITDPMLDEYWPPNHFGCRTRMRQLTGVKPSPKGSYALPDIPDLFKMNVGKTGMIFPQGHAYFTDLPLEVKNEANVLRLKANSRG